MAKHRLPDPKAPERIEGEAFPDGSERHRGGLNYVVLRGWVYWWCPENKWARIRHAEPTDYYMPPRAEGVD